MTHGLVNETKFYCGLPLIKAKPYLENTVEIVEGGLKIKILK